MCGIDIFWFVFLENSDSVRNEFGSVRFKKFQFGLDIVVIYSSCNSKYYSDSGCHDFDITDVTHNNDDK